MRALYTCYAMMIFTAATVAAEPSSPVLVSPGSTERAEGVVSTCPTFIWAGPARASIYELAVYEVSDEGSLGDKVVQERLPGGAQAWAPPVRHCLDRAKSYAWMVGAVGADGTTWSEPAFFRVTPGPTELELIEALRIVRSYIGSIEGGVSAEEVETSSKEGSVKSSRPVGKSTSTKVGGSLFNISGGVEAASFTGSGMGLTDLDPASLSSGTAAIDISGNAANITGTLGSGQLSGTYGSALTFSSASNSFTGDGSGLTGVSATDPTKVLKAGDTMTGPLTLTPGAGNALVANADVNLANGSLLKAGTLFLHNNGTGNTGLGTLALSGATGGSNTAVGRDALRASFSGSNNTAVGSDALEDNTASDNTAMGQQALSNNTGGGDNTAFGKEALRANTSGNDNTAIGEEALETSTGDGNIALGEDAGSNLVTGDDNIYIGNPGRNNESYTLRIGETIDRTFIGGIRGVTTGISGAITVMVDSLGQLGTTSSSKRFKTNIRDMGDVSSRLFQLRPVSFAYKQHVDNPESASAQRPMEYGLIAEEVEEIFPELVAYDQV